MGEARRHRHRPKAARRVDDGGARRADAAASRENKRLQMEREILKKARPCSRRKAREIRVHRGGGGVRLLCTLLELSPSGYYAWGRRPAPPKATADAQLVVEIRAALTRGRGAYGSPPIHPGLQAHRRPPPHKP